MTKYGLNSASSANLAVSSPNSEYISTVSIDYAPIEFVTNEEAQLNFLAQAWQMGKHHPLLTPFGISFDHIETVYRSWSVISFDRIQNLQISFNDAKTYFVDETIDFWLTMDKSQTLSQDFLIIKTKKTLITGIIMSKIFVKFFLTCWEENFFSN